MKRYLVTSALPYANGQLHFGHLAGVYLPSDVYVRHLKMLGEKVLHICGSDEHGVAIMLNAKKARKDYKEYVDYWHGEFVKLFESYQVDFDFFGQTSADYHQVEVEKWFHALHEKGFIGTKDNQQLQCKDCHNHLPDRFVEGECYSCGYEKARGDECPSCGILIESTRLKNPVCQICKSTNIHEVTVTQYYLLLSKYHKEFRSWFEAKEGSWRKTVWPFVDSLSKEDLHDRAISRDLDWGIDVPLDEAKGKKLYVWFDAPIGYISNLKKFLEDTNSGEDYQKDWIQNKDCEMIHFLGKDNIIFHCIIFPVMGMASGRMNPPADVPANQYLNLQGKQFSKSQGWYVDAVEAMDQFGPDALRYYLLSIMPDFTDSSFTWDQFGEKVNNELANNIGNLVNRCLKFWGKNWAEGLPETCFSGFYGSEQAKKFAQGIAEIKSELGQKNIRKGLELIMKLGHETNAFFNDRAPWAEFKVDPDKAAVTIAETGMQIFTLGLLLKPFLPQLGSNIIELFGSEFSENDMRLIYGGDLSALKNIFKGNFKLAKIPKVLVPKIDEKVLKSLNEKLAEAANG